MPEFANIHRSRCSIDNESAACRQSVESTRQYETQRAANERLLEEKENLNRNLSKLREEKGGVEQRLRNANQDLTKSKVL